MTRPVDPASVDPGSAVADAPPAWAPDQRDVPAGPHAIPARVRFLECDPQGVMAHPRFLDLFDDAYMAVNTTRFGGFAAMIAGGLETLVVRTEVEFSASCRAEDLLVLEVALERLGTSSVTLRFSALGAARRELRARARTTYVCVDAREKRSLAIPAWMRERYAALAPAD